MARNRVRCYFVHGWGMNSAVWQGCAVALPPVIDAVFIDLPGHGSQRDAVADDLAGFVEHAAAFADAPGHWVGWSLGGLVTLQLAYTHPHLVTSLFQVACNPCFVQRPGWPHAVEASVFDAFGESLHADVQATIRRFLALQVRGTGTGIATVRKLQSALDEAGQATTKALQTGLEILTHTDARSIPPVLSCAQYWMFGGRDALVPVAVAAQLQNMNRGLQVRIIDAAGHALFLSHRDAFAASLGSAIMAS